MKFPRWLYKYFILIPVLIVIHWKFLDDQCSLTILQELLKIKKIIIEQFFRKMIENSL